jgi:hypothetical protein
MKEFMEDEWEDFEKLEEDVYKKTSSLWASSNADARVRVRVKHADHKMGEAAKINLQDNLQDPLCYTPQNLL